MTTSPDSTPTIEDEQEDARLLPPVAADETTMLARWIDWHRDTLAQKCSGLTPAQLATRSAAPSSMSLLGLVRHLADVERSWFRNVIAAEGAAPLFYSDEHPDGEFDLVDPATADDASVAEAFDAWRAECDNARKVTAALTSLDAMRPYRRGPRSVRWILVHMVEEYARHNGHADLLRERIDGVTGE